MVDAGGQRDLAAEVGGVDLQPQLALVLGQRPVHGVDIEDIGFAGLQPRLQDALPELAGVDLAQHLARLGALQAEHRIVAHRKHEFVGDVDAVMKIEALAVEVAGGFADLQEFLDLGMGNVEIDRSAAPAQRPLADRQGQPVHHMDEGNDARGLAGLHLLADGADLAPISADAAAIGGQRHILVPDADNAVQRIRDVIEEAGNRQPAIGAAIGEDGRGGHEPKLAHGVIQALGMGDVVGIGAGNAREHVLEAFARHQIAVGQRGLAEGGEQDVARAVELEIGRHGLARQRRRKRRLGRRPYQILDGLCGNGRRRSLLRQLRAIRGLDQLALLIEIAQNIEFSHGRHAHSPKPKKRRSLEGKFRHWPGRIAPHQMPSLPLLI